MKKTFAKLMAMLLVVMLVAALCVPVFADDDVQITVTTTDPADTQSNTRTYNYYKILDGSFVDPADPDAGVTYYLNAPADAAKKAALEAVTVGGNAVFTFTESADGDRWTLTSDLSAVDAKDLAAALKDMVDATGSPFTKSGDFAADVPQTVNPGYYLIISSLGTELILNTFVATTVTEKNDYPTSNKVDDKEYASIGEDVTYTVEVVIPATVAEKAITIVDTISKGLTMNVNVTVTGAAASPAYTEATWVENGSYVAADEEKQYTITIPAEVVTANAGGTLTFTYTATLNNNAVVLQDETNDAHIEYDQFITKDVQATVTTLGYTIKKIKGADAAGKTDAEKLELTALAGAEFSLWTAATGGDQIFVKLENGVYRADVSVTCNAPDANDPSVTDPATIPDVIQAGEATIEGLTAGTYYLQEDKAPNGYNALADRVEIIVNDTSALAGVDSTIENNTGTVLPSTGGVGTTIFYIVGGLLVVGAGVLLITKKRMNRE